MEKLLEIMERLLGPGGCAWDQEQTVSSLRKYMEEECQEVLAARDDKNLCEELGDLLFNVLFMSRVAQKEGRFTVQDVVDGISEKLIRRHPHVFGDAKVDSMDELIAQWERIKTQEKLAEG